MQWEGNWRKIENSKSIKGGQDSVSKVENIHTREYGALKELHLDKLSTERKVRFKGEIETIKRLNLDRIPKILEHSFDEESNEYYYISQWIEGQTLSNYVDQTKNISIDLAIDICRNLCNILISCHHQKVYHRDIKPDNILITKDKEIYLIDFGISHDEKDEFITPVGQELGNRFLKLPELAKGESKKADPRSDVTFVVGILYFLLYGSSPNQLLNQNSLPPHKVKEPSNREILSDPRWLLIEILFDRGFKYEIRERLPSIQDLLLNLDSVMTFDPEEPNADIFQIVSDFNKLNELSLKDHRKVEVLLRDGVNLLTKKIKEICISNGFSEIHQLAQSEKNGKVAGQLWKLSKKNHNEPYVFLNVIIELSAESENIINVFLKTPSSERKVNLSKSYYQGGLYNIVELSKESEKIAGEIFKDAVKLLMEKIKLIESESSQSNA